MKRVMLAGWLALLCACGTSAPPPGQVSTEERAGSYTSQPGPTPVGVIPIATINDAVRKKEVTMSIEYPTRGGPHPVIIFSHGLAGSTRGYVGLSSYWASYDYVVIKPAHADAERSRDSAALMALADAQGETEWRDRVADIRLIINSFPALEELYPELKGKLDSTRIGVGGHGYGAFTATLLAGGRTFRAAQPATYGDARIKAALAMSPQGPSQRYGLTRESWAEVRVPFMFMTGTQDQGREESEGPAWRSEAFELSPPGDKWLVTLEGASSATFTGQMPPIEAPRREEPMRDPRTGQIYDPRDPRTTRRIDPGMAFMRQGQLFNRARVIALAFWDTYLKGRNEGREYLSRLDERGVAAVQSK